MIDKSDADYAGMETINIWLMLAGLQSFIEIREFKYLNNRVEQDQHFMKKITKPMMGFKAFHSAKAHLDGIETAHMVRKSNFPRKTCRPIGCLLLEQYNFFR